MNKFFATKTFCFVRWHSVNRTVSPAVQGSNNEFKSLVFWRWIFLLLTLFCLQPASATPTTPTSDFTDNQDGTVTHKTTGLTWMRCAMGQTWTGSTCSGAATRYNYAEAVALVSNFAGHNDWRVPNIAELHTIVERENYNSAINNTIFPNTFNNTIFNISDVFWSSSPNNYYDSCVWIVHFNDGDDHYCGSKYYHYAVRLVRGGRSFDSLPLTTPTSDFIDNQDGTVMHKRTGLVWQRCSVGQIWTDSTCSGTASFYTYEAAMAFKSNFAGKSDWRLPNENELLSILEYGAFKPAINTALFPNNTSQYEFWSSSVYKGTNNAWIVGFYEGGYDYWRSNGSGKLVRFVRGKWSSGLPKPPEKQVVLLLHGMNSNPGTWNDVITQYFPKANCPSIYNGKINSPAKPNTEQTYCYRVKFGAFDADSSNKGLEDAWEYGESNGYDSAGDYSDFNQLGTEVDKAITAIKNSLPNANAKILLVAHSRGGLAARAFLQQPSFENRSSVAGLITTGTPHEGTRLGRIYSYIKAVLLNDGTRVTDADALNDWQAIDFLSGKADCNAVLGNLGFKIDARRPVIGYLRDHSPMINSLNNNKANLPSAIQYGELVYNGVRLGQLDEKLNGFFAYNLFDEPDYADICHQVSRTAEAVIKGGTAAAPIASTKYLGDGIVTASSQGSIVFPKAERVTYKSSVLHTKEPQQTAHIADIACQLEFSLLNSCPATAQVSTTKQAQAPFKSVEIVSHDYDALVALKAEQLWQDWLAIITDDTQANQRDQLAVALGIKLRDSDNAAFYADVEQRLLNTNAPQLERARLAKLLAEIATPSALGILTDALLNPDCSVIQTALSNAIITVADSLPEQPRRADLSAVLETAWTLPKQNQQQHITLALALAKLGTPRGVELLLTAVDKTDATLPSAKKKPLNPAQQQAIAAFMVMDEIINPDSETVLENTFMSHHAKEAVFIAAGNGLVNLGSDGAAQRVLQRINELPDNAVLIGQQWLRHLSGKIDKTALRSMSKTVGLPRQRLLRQQMEEMVQ